MTFEQICQYILEPLVVLLISGLFLTRLGVQFQKKLLDQQLEFQRKQSEEDALQREDIYKRLEKAIEVASANISAGSSVPVPTHVQSIQNPKSKRPR